jgi:hypothetical protein
MTIYGFHQDESSDLAADSRLPAKDQTAAMPAPHGSIRRSPDERRPKQTNRFKSKTAGAPRSHYHARVR